METHYGHAILPEQPEFVAQAIIAFLRAQVGVQAPEGSAP